MYPNTLKIKEIASVIKPTEPTPLLTNRCRAYYMNNMIDKAFLNRTIIKLIKYISLYHVLIIEVNRN
jgi:hypothetical protein